MTISDISNGDSGLTALTEINDAFDQARRVEYLTFSTPGDLRAAGIVPAAGQWERAETHWPPRTYYWADDCALSETAADDVIIPDGHSGAGRWVYAPRFNFSNPIHSLPRLTQKQLAMSTNGEYRVIILADSLGAKYTTSLPGENFWSFLSRQFYEKSNLLLETAFTIASPGAALGSQITRSDNSAEALVGFHFVVPADTSARFRTGGSDPFADSVRVYYTQEPGAGELTVTLTAYTTGETASVTVDADGVRSSKYVDLTLPGNITGKVVNKRVYVDVTTVGGPVKFPEAAVEAKDTAVVGKKLVYNRWTSRGGYTFLGPNFATNADVLAQYIVDFNPDLILVEYADPLDSGRVYVDTLISELEDRDFYPDILLVGTTEVYQAGVTDSLVLNATDVNGVKVDNLRQHAATLKAFSEVKPNVHFHDYGAVIRSQFYGLETGVYTESDHIHPTANGTASLISDLIRCIPTMDFLRGVQYLSQSIARSLTLVGGDNSTLASGQADAVTIIPNGSGDLTVNFRRQFILANWLSGSAVNQMEVTTNGVFVRELRFTGSNARVTSTVNNEIFFNSSRLTGIVAGINAGDAVIMSQIVGSDTAANIASAAAAINTTGKFTGRLVWDTTNNRMMRAMGTATTSAWRTMDGVTIVTPS